jgi:hypothetical protein
MNKPKFSALLISASLAALAAPGLLLPATAQDQDQVRTTAPIVLKAPKPKKDKFKGTVVVANRAQFTVQSSQNQRVVRTYKYSPKAWEKMVQVIDRGGYQFGDKVEVISLPGSDVALEIKGKPSKSK